MNSISRFFGAFLRQDAVEFPSFSPAPALEALAEWGGARPLHRLRSAETVIAAVGDIHGRLDLLRRLEPALDGLRQEGRGIIVEVYLGDFVDHAGDAKATFDFLIERRRRIDRRIVCLCGNHERMLLTALEDPDYFARWLRFGGEATIRSYGVAGGATLRNSAKAFAVFRELFPRDHREFLESLPKRYEFEDFYFVHAGVNPAKTLAEQTEDDMLWIREPFLSSTANFGKVVVHGHTPLRSTEVRRNRIGLDTGAYLTGRLSCLILTSDGLRIIDTLKHGGVIPIT